MSASEPFVGEIYMFGGNFAPRGWAICAGQLLAIVQNTALFSLLGTTYGGDGQTTFALPDLQGRIPIHAGQGPGTSNRVQGELEGSETVTLISSQLPSHRHTFIASKAVSSEPGPGNDVAGDSTLAGALIYGAPSSPAAMSPDAIGVAGGGQAHQNMMPFLCVNFIIALEGIFPSRN